MNSGCTLDRKIINIANYEYGFFLNKTNVLGVGLGYKTKNGFCTGQKCIKIFVCKKVSSDKLDFKNLIPSFYKGIPTDVIEGGYFNFQILNSVVRPTICGYSIGPNSVEYTFNIGSIGCVVTDGNFKYLLSSSHILSALNKLPINTSVVQPSLADIGFPGNQVGDLSKFSDLKPESLIQKPTNTVDCAIVKLSPYVQAFSDIAFIGKTKGVGVANLHDFVFKVGRTTDETNGSIVAINSTCQFKYDDIRDTKKYLFKNQIITSKMSSPGDSGSVLVNTKKEIIGLLMGGSTSNTVYNDIHLVLNYLNVNIVF